MIISCHLLDYNLFAFLYPSILVNNLLQNGCAIRSHSPISPSTKLRCSTDVFNSMTEVLHDYLKCDKCTLLLQLGKSPSPLQDRLDVILIPVLSSTISTTIFLFAEIIRNVQSLLISFRTNIELLIVLSFFQHFLVNLTVSVTGLCELEQERQHQWWMVREREKSLQPSSIPNLRNRKRLSNRRSRVATSARLDRFQVVECRSSWVAKSE